MSNGISDCGTIWWFSYYFLFFFVVVQAHCAARTQTGQRLLDAFADRIRGRKRDG